jgi:hypothetical protein
MTTLISHVVSAATWDAMARHHTACSKKLRAIDTTRNCPPRPPPPAAAARPPAVAAARRNCPPPPAHPPPLRVAITHPAAVAVTVTETRKRSAPCGYHEQDTAVTVPGRDLPSSTFQLNLSRVLTLSRRTAQSYPYNVLR